ncbi:MAG: hypothetical protein JOZ86_00750 [Candidatus Eremiobacteraeota bacterium]|nr:hypothetical protein [Candidatus Eremiobacteraeota bacterium]
MFRLLSGCYALTTSQIWVNDLEGAQMLTEKPRWLLAVVAPSLALFLSSCGTVTSNSTPLSSSIESDAVLPTGAGRPLTSLDSLASVVRDTTAGSNLNSAQLVALNRATAIKGVFPMEHTSSLHIRRPNNITAASPFEHANIGSFFDVSGYNGVYAIQSWAINAIAPGSQPRGVNPQGGATSNVVFADTTKGPGNECFESGTGYWAAAPNDVASSPLSAFYVFDFCKNGGEFVVVKTLGTSSWYNYSYVVQHTDGTISNVYSIENFLASDGNWHAMLYNQRTSTWEDLAMESGSLQSGNTPGNPGGEGWSFTEYYNEPNQPLGSPGYCQDIGYDTNVQQSEPVQASAFLLPIGSTTLEEVSPSNTHFEALTNDPSGIPQCWSTQQGGAFPSYQFTYVGSTGTTVPARKWKVITHNF